MIMAEALKNGPQFIRIPLELIYNNLPESFKYSREYLKNYYETYDLLNKSQWWSKEQLEIYQMEQIKKIVKHAYQTVPYYNKLFDEYGISVGDIKSFDDIKKIPYLTKDIIHNNLEDLISNKYQKNKMIYAVTGGSTGIPMGLYQYRDYEYARESAFIRFLYDKIGYKDGEKTLILRGSTVKSINEKMNIFFEINYGRNELVASSFHLSEKNLKYYVEAIKKFKPVCIKAYPSSLYLLARYIKKEKIDDFDFIKYIILASENINTIQNELFQDVFKHARIFSFYGHTEHACIAGACEVSDYYHIQSEYGYMELINSKDKYVEKEDEIGEIVATGFNNYVMPLIRYATSDLAVNTNQSCKCGRNYKLIKRLEGRKQEFILDRNNEIITFTNHDETLWDVKDKMSAYQYVQNEPGKVILNIQPKEKLSHLEEYEVEKNFNEYYPNIEIKIAFVKHIKRTKRGKFKYLIQNVKIL